MMKWEGNWNEFDTMVLLRVKNKLPVEKNNFWQKIDNVHVNINNKVSRVILVKQENIWQR